MTGAMPNLVYFHLYLYCVAAAFIQIEVQAWGCQRDRTQAPDLRAINNSNKCRHKSCFGGLFVKITKEN